MECLAMANWGVQLVIGKLLTDEEFRRRFERRPRECLLALRARGFDVSDQQMSALAEVDSREWNRMAARVNRRLHIKPPLGDGEDRPALPPLTEREQRVLRGVFEGLTNKQIGAECGATEGAVKAIIQQLFRKARVRSRAQLVRVAIGVR
jgi:DNA-binding NarL/FixJ family response regulator